MRLLLGVLVVLAGTVASAQELPKPLPQKIVKAWTDAGAQVGWFTVSGFGFSELTPPVKSASAGRLRTRGRLDGSA